MASAVSSAAQQLGKLLAEEATSLYNVRDKIQNLQKELIYMDGFLQDADTQQYQQRRVQIWVSDIQDLAYDAEDLIVRYLHEVPHHRRDGIRNTIKWFSTILCLCDGLNLHNLSSDIDGLRERISELKSRLQTYDIKISEPTANSEYNAKIMEDRRTYSHTHEDVVGIDGDIIEVVDQLVKTDYKVVVLSGIGGLGKTTLARRVFKHKDVKNHFKDNCAWVYISKEFKKENIFKLVLLGLEKSEEGRKRIKELQPEELCEELHKVLEAKRCLVVIDDIWNEEAWKSIKSGFESVCATTSTSKILLTTRDRGLFQHVDPSAYDRPLKHLSDDESWTLLKRNAYIGQLSTTCTGEESSTSEQTNMGENEPQDVDRVMRENEMERMGRKMLKHCNGIPIAIVALGGILSHKKTISEWKEVSNSISSYLMDDILKVIELSFHDLPFYLKSCFLYLGNFPEYYKISTMRLYNLWEAVGFLVIEDEAVKRRGSIYEIGERYLNQLIDRCMVQVGECGSDGRVKECQLHDVMRDMCLRKCEETGFLNHIKGGRDSTESADMKKWRRCAVSYGNTDDIDKQFELGERVVGVRSLLVFQRKQKFSMVWKCFPLLRVLDLEGVRFIDSMDMDGLGLLIHLRYLSLKKTVIRKLPLCVYNLNCLETLDLRVSTMERIMLRNKFDKMKRLRHLYLPRDFEVEGGEKLKFQCSVMETIKNFDTKRCDLEDITEMTKLRVFSFTEDNTLDKWEDVKLLMEAPVIKNERHLFNSLRLHIHSDTILEEDMLAIRKLPRLKVLELWKFVGNKLSLLPGSFPHLTTLDLWCSDELEELYVADGALSNLQTLYLSDWKTGFTLLALEKLCNLKSLHLNCIGVDKLNFVDGIFPQLTELNIYDAKELEELSFGDAALPNLQRLEFSFCEKLKKLSNIPNTITSVVITGGGDIFSLGFDNLPHLQRLYVFGSYWRVLEGEKKLVFPAGSFPHVTLLGIGDNGEMEELELGIGALPNLQRLELYRCRKLKKLPQGLPPSIRIRCDDPCIPGSENYNTTSWNYKPHPLPPVAATRNKWVTRLFQRTTNTN